MLKSWILVHRKTIAACVIISATCGLFFFLYQRYHHITHEYVDSLHQVLSQDEITQHDPVEQTQVAEQNTTIITKNNRTIMPKKIKDLHSFKIKKPSTKDDVANPQEITTLKNIDRTMAHHDFDNQAPSAQNNPDNIYNLHKHTLSTFSSSKDFGLKTGCSIETLFAAGHNVSLLNGSTPDHACYIQTMIDFPCTLTIPKQTLPCIDMNITPRINTLWGSTELQKVSAEQTKIGLGITEGKHDHSLRNIPIFLKEAWIKFYNKSENQQLQIGLFPYQIGLGLVLGNQYRTGEVQLLNIQEKFIDQYRPGIEYKSTFTLHDKEYKANIYYSGYDNQATTWCNFLQNTNTQALAYGGKGPVFTKCSPQRPKLQMNHIVSAQIDIPFIFRQHNNTINFNLKPFFMFNKDQQQMVEFRGDAQSALFTAGTSLVINQDKMKCFIDIAGNFGHQSVKAWDRNTAIRDNCLTMTHLFRLSNNTGLDTSSSDFCCGANSTSIAADECWVLAPEIPCNGCGDQSLQYAAGQEFKIKSSTEIVDLCCLDATETIDLDTTTFKNSFSRFRKSYKVKFSGFLFAADACYELSDKHIVGLIAGVASGDDYPHDTYEKSILYRLRSDWNSVRLDKPHSYLGFQGIQPLYSGNFVRSLYLLRANKLQRTLSNDNELTANIINNLMYTGLGFWKTKEYNSGTLKWNTNIIGMMQPHSLRFGLDPVVGDVYSLYNYACQENKFKNFNKQLNTGVGIEINSFLEFFAKNSVKLYGNFGIFLPGSYYKDIHCLSYKEHGKNVPIVHQLAVLKEDVSGYDDSSNMRLRLNNDISYTLSVGLTFDFDTYTIYRSKKQIKKKKGNS